MNYFDETTLQITDDHGMKWLIAFDGEIVSGFHNDEIDIEQCFNIIYLSYNGKTATLEKIATQAADYMRQCKIECKIEAANDAQHNATLKGTL